MSDYNATVDLPFTRVGLVLDGQQLSKIDFSIRNKTTGKVGANVSAITRQLLDYCRAKGKKFTFDCDLKVEGTDFQKKVWKELTRIPYGEVRTYGDIAKKLHSSPRAVGNACRKNPVPIIIPCHRVVAANSLGGYGGETAGKNMQIKQWLLRHEGYLAE